MRLGAALLLAGALAWGGYERWQHVGWRDYAHRLEHTSQASQKAQEALRTQERAQYEEQARENNARYSEDLSRARDLTDRHIAGHRLQPQGDRSAAEPIGEAGAASLPAPVSTQTVVVDESDVRTCGDLYAYALNAHDWALSITGDK